MRILLDTQIALWSAAEPEKLSKAAQALLTDPENDVLFSVINLWEVAIKRALRRPDFDVDPQRLRARMKAVGLTEVMVTGEHALGVEHLPLIHHDPFDRLLVSQALSEGLTLLTTDWLLDGYPGDIRRV